MLDVDIESWKKIQNDLKTCILPEYAYGSVLYQNKYFSDVHDELIDVSFVIYNGGVATGIWPLCIYRDSKGYQIGSWGGVLLPPLLKESGQTVESKRRLLRKCINALKEIGNRFNICQYNAKDIVFDKGISLWSQMMLEDGAVCYGIRSECFLDLSMDEQDILSKIRRTNKYSIKKAQSLWKSEIITKESGKDRVKKCFEEFRKLHIEVCGRETRRKETWDLQCDSMLDTNNFVVLLYDFEENLIGASLFSTTNSVGTYSVAAYKRELFDQPVSHISQWLAIKHMKELGLKWYYIGSRMYKGDWDHPNEKEISIGYFKEGYATNLFFRLYLKCNTAKWK